ncbi:hypothetical protein Ccrd_017737 [Cynara cardunculus var. scolymus]|uniref:BHLH domain-containing protein n=1 Tax=Cynara cardunculus var. scolymus TaxID=59895 RepID=A0A103Y7K1_CYNCS|nr:hypothetical protein Ccrd_017737 [Cynara cardunculus var. scolymus]
MMAAAGPPYDGLKRMLQSAVQSVQWTYTIFWKFCPQGRVLVWGDGYYNGAIKTRKTVQSVEVSTEEAALSRSEQLRELYDSLETGDHQVTDNQQQPPIRRPSVALSPEDLTESEWFYLMCVSFSFPPGVGLVGEAYAKQQQLWLTGANEVDSKTVVCIPLLNGVVELGTTEKDKSGMAAAVEDVNELLEVDMSEDIRFGSPNDGSSHFDSGFQLLPRSQADSCRAESPPRWSDSLELHQLHASAEPEDDHYSRTVSTILHNQLRRWSDDSQSAASGRNSLLYTTQSSFTMWTSTHHPKTTPSNSQWLLKYMLYTVPFLHTKSKSLDSVPKTMTSHEELMSANHVLAERRRREKLSERFIILRSLVPLVTKMDKASILGDTIEYVKQLRKKIQDLEALDHSSSKMRKIRVAEGSGGRTAVAVQVEVSIIESDALVEIQCLHREGLLLDVMKKLRELGVEITTVQSCVNGGMCMAEMRAKVKAKGNNGKKISIMQVKKAIGQIVSPSLY